MIKSDSKDSKDSKNKQTNTQKQMWTFISLKNPENVSCFHKKM